MSSFDVGRRILELAAKFQDLLKADPELRSAMEHFRSKASTPEDQQHLETIRKRMFLDKLTNGMVGNHASFEEEQESPDFHTGYIHLFMDGNDHKAMNDNLGYAEGDNAIRNYAQAIRGSVDDIAGRQNAKIHRLGGDEFHVMIKRSGNPDKDHATAGHVVRELTKRVDGLVPMGGQFRHSLKIGIGHTYHAAEEAQREAKKVKNSMNYPKGQARTHVHSLLPGHEGAVPLSGEFDLVP